MQVVQELTHVKGPTVSAAASQQCEATLPEASQVLSGKSFQIQRSEAERVMFSFVLATPHESSGRVAGEAGPPCLSRFLAALESDCREAA